MRYREVIRMPLWLMALIYFFLLSVVLSLWVSLGNNAALVALVIVTALMILLRVKTALVIEVDELEVRVGCAHIELQYIDSTHVLTPQEMKTIRTRDADPAAYLAIRFWNAHGVKLELNDDRDSTPYWLITTKKSQELSKLLNSLKV